MKTRAVASLMLVLMAKFAFADASYQSTSQITGGSFVDSLKGQAFISKQVNQMFAPTNTIVMVHGNQKATVNKDSIEIIDLDAGTITRVDTEKKTYTVTTFDQMRKMLANLPQQMKQAQAQVKQAEGQTPLSNMQMSFDAQVKDTGVTKMVNGLMATEHILTLTMRIAVPDAATAPGGATPAATSAAPAPADTPAGTPAAGAIAYTVTTDMWIAPDPPQVKEIEAFDVRMGEKMMQGVDMKALMASWQANGSGAGMSMMFGNQPGAAEAMKHMQEEMRKLKGTHVLEVTSMGGNGMAPATPADGSQAAAPASNTSNSGTDNSSGTPAGQAAQGTATGAAEGQTGRLGGVGGALSNSVVGMFHRKKAQQQDQTAPAANSTGTPGGTAAGTPGSAAAGTPVRAVLMETTKQETNFSSDPVPVSVFHVPAGYKQVPSQMDKMSQ
jgi:hypothetical protein